MKKALLSLAVVAMLVGAYTINAAGSKVQVCHKGKAQWVSSNAVAAHLAHGDALGDCTVPTGMTAEE